MANESNYTSAYQEALSKINSGEDPTGSSIPSYINSADTLNIANGNPTFLESASSVIDNVPKFIATSLLSGVNQLYNIPADVGNLFGGNFETADTYEVISSLDSNLGKFYEENKAGPDLVGFILGSMIPGLAGVKMLNAGQASLRGAIGAGKFGTSTGKALGLLAPKKALDTVAYKTALSEVVTNSSAANLLSRNTLKAIGSGAGQNVLEAAAFEGAVAATMFNSPILEDQDFGDFISNVAFSAGVFGILGGAVDAAKVSYGLKKAGDAAYVEARPWTSIAESASASSPYEKVVLDYQQLNDIPKIPVNIPADRSAFLKVAADTKVTTLENRLRTEMGGLAKGDQVVAETLFNTFKSADINTKQGAFIGLMETARMAAPAKIAERFTSIQNKMVKGTATVEEIAEFQKTDLAIGYTKAWGEDAGRVTFETPKLTSLIDFVKPGSAIEVTAKGVKAGTKKYSFGTAYNMGAISKLGTAKAWSAALVDPLEAQARYIWASKLPTFQASPTNIIKVHIDDLPLMEKVLKDVPAEDLKYVEFKGLAKNESIGTSLQDFLGDRKIMLANKLLDPKASATRTQEEIAAIVNVKSSMLSGEVLSDATSKYNRADILALQDHAEKYTEQLVKQNSRKATDPIVDIWNIPQHLKLTYDTSTFKDIGNNVIENMVTIKQQQKLYQEGTGRMAANVLREDYDKFEDITSGRVFSGAVPSGAGSGLLTAASSNYGTLAATVENIGKTTANVIEKFKARTTEALEPLLYKLGTNPAAAIEWSALQQRVRAIEGEYGLNAAGTGLEPIKLIRWKAAAQAAQEVGESIPARPILPAAMEDFIEIQYAETRNLAKAHIELNGKRTNDLAGLRTSQGLQFNRGSDVFYPIPVNTADYPFFAIVTDESITSGNHAKMLYANTEVELEAMAAKLKQNPQLRVRFKKEAEDYYKSTGQWDYEKTLNSNYLDTEAHRKGISAPFIVATDPKKITSDMLNWHVQRETGLVREAVSAKYEVQFEELRRLGEGFTNVAMSKFSNASLNEYVDSATKNPFADYIKTALAIKKTNDYPFLTNLNRIADQALSNVLKRATNVMETAKTDTELAEINTMLTKAGYKGAAYDESMAIFANATPTTGALSALVQKGNSILATVVLRWDAINAVNNAVSANVLLGAETKAIQRAISRGDSEAAGALAKLMDVKVPGVDGAIKAPSKLIANAIKKFNAFDAKSSPDFKFYEDNGFITSISKQYSDTLNDLTFNPAEGVDSWSKKMKLTHEKLKKAANTGERWTGNKLAEEFNRFVAADVMKQMTDVAVSRNLMTAKEQLAYINTFVNRTQGNYLAAQRPMLFQGPIGQAVGLFQTYQFNLIQQLLRHVGEGHAKDSMTLLALQGTIHGMNGLPGFNAINTYVLGTASGNTEHKDAFDAVYGAAGKEGGEWIMYGAASNLLGLIDPELKMNLYTRGDINPRHLTIVPTDPSQLPIVQATGKVFGNMFETVKKLQNGGAVASTILQGIEHNGLSRPLAGLAQTLQGLTNPEHASYSTSNQGNVIAANDLMSLTNLGRVLGAKPLDEAIALDATYRYKAYGLGDAKKRMVLGEAIKSTMMAGNDPSQEQVEEFASKYAATGGRQEEFAGWMSQLYRTANTSQANKIQQSLNSPYSKSMQLLMGGEELGDFNNQ